MKIGKSISEIDLKSSDVFNLSYGDGTTGKISDELNEVICNTFYDFRYKGIIYIFDLYWENYENWKIYSPYR